MYVGMRGRFGGGIGIPNLQQLEDNCRLLGVQPSVEICPFTAQQHIDVLNQHNYQIDHFESIFVRESMPEGIFPAASPKLTIEALQTKDVETWAYITMRLSRKRIPPDHPHIQFASAAYYNPQIACFLARLDGEPVGTSAISIRHERASLSFLGMHPDFRRHGVQQAMIAHSIDYAHSSGAALVVTVETPHDTALHNLIRIGFSNAYTRIVMTQRST
jgi:ribosomal protein S18 acetylase RimI-like enzyme